MAANVPMIDKGTTAPGITVAETLRRNRKMTITTRHTVSTRVNSTSRMDLRMDCEASNATFKCTVGGISLRNTGKSFITLSTTWTVFVPGCRFTDRKSVV